MVSMRLSTSTALGQGLVQMTISNHISKSFLCTFTVVGDKLNALDDFHEDPYIVKFNLRGESH